VKSERNLEAAKPPATTRVSNLRPLRAQVAEPPYTAPYVRWCGRGERATAPPIPILWAKVCASRPIASSAAE
jgi:hypothetical protein